MFSVCANPECQAPFDYQARQIVSFSQGYYSGREPAKYSLRATFLALLQVLEYLHLGIPKQAWCGAQEFPGNIGQPRDNSFYSCRLAG
jgi:hypothetical protein